MRALTHDRTVALARALAAIRKAGRLAPPPAALEEAEDADAGPAIRQPADDRPTPLRPS